MCNERESSEWNIRVNGTDTDSTDCSNGTVHISNLSDSLITCNNTDDWNVSLCASNIYTKNDHAESGVNRKFDATLVDSVDMVYREHWDLPEYIPFRECIKMGIQDGIQAGMRRSREKYDKMLSERDRKIEETKQEAERWKKAFKGLLTKCQEGIDALDFISKVVHVSRGNKA